MNKKENPGRKRILDILKDLNKDPADNTLQVFGNAHGLYNEIMQSIKFETDINQVKETVEYYVDIICNNMPDGAATTILKEIYGIEEK